MKQTTQPRPACAPGPELSPKERPTTGFWSDLRGVILPATKWHYTIHAVVLAVALSYWIGSLIFLKDASWAEVVMYRPTGDNQLWPVVHALSRFNFGDPTDALHYGKGVGGFHAVILLPYALAFAMLGAPGYMITDAILVWGFFVSMTMLLRRWGMSALGSTVLGAALATVSLQAALQKVAQVFSKFLSLFGLEMAEWGFPDLFSLAIFGKRIPRPLPTEIFVVLVLYFLAREWQERRPPTFRRGLALGVLMGVLAQGDPFSFSALGLLGLVTFLRTVRLQGWKAPWRLGAGALVGAACVGWYFVVQMLAQHPDSAVRFGLAPYSRAKFHILPGYAPWIRLLLIALLAGAVHLLVRRRAAAKSGRAAKNRRETISAEPAVTAASIWGLAWFALAMVLCAWLAQPVQLLLLGKGAQIYHYFLYTLPTFYSYALVLLLILVFKFLNEAETNGREGASPPRSRPATAVLCGGSMLFMLVLGTEDSIDVIKHSGLSRRDAGPWITLGDTYRPNFRALDKEFRQNPALKNARTFVTFCQEVNFLLAGFHNKRAYLPDNAFTTLSDAELEERLISTCKMFRFSPESFANVIQDWYTMNYWLGCAKYWCSSDYKFAADDEYPPEYLDAIRRLPNQTAFNLAMPRSEYFRITGKFDERMRQPRRATDFLPDVVVATSILRERGISVDPALYREVYTNQVFSVYTRSPQP